MTAPPTSGTGANTGVVSAYSSTAAASITAGAVSLATVTVPTPGWYQATVWAWLGNTTTGVGSVDGLNIALYSDPEVAASMVYYAIVPWDALGISNSVVPQTFRVYANSTITVESMGAATGSTNYVVQLVVNPI